MVKSKKIPLSPDAALVAALAGTAMPFSHSAEDQVERWLRAMRLHGQVGAALQALGVGESPLRTVSEQSPEEGADAPPLEGDVVQRVVDAARTRAEDRSAGTVGTADLLCAVCEVYEGRLDRALYLRGTSCDELAERLEATERHAEAR